VAFVTRKSLESRSDAASREKRETRRKLETRQYPGTGSPNYAVRSAHRFPISSVTQSHGESNSQPDVRHVCSCPSLQVRLSQPLPRGTRSCLSIPFLFVSESGQLDSLSLKFGLTVTPDRWKCYNCVRRIRHPIQKVKAFPYSIPSAGPGADPGVQAVSPQVTISHPPGGRLP